MIEAPEIYRVDEIGWVVDRPEAVMRILKDRAFGVAPAPPLGDPFGRFVAGWLTTLDGTTHRTQRGRLLLAWRETLDARGPSWLRDIATARARSLTPGATFDGIADFARPLVERAVADLVGCKELGRSPEWIRQVADGLDPLADRAARAAAAVAANELIAWVARVARAPELATGLVARLDATTRESDLAMLLFGGLETTIGLLGHLLLAVASCEGRGGDGDAARRDELVEGVLAREAPVQAITRIAVRDVSIGDVMLKAGEPITLLLGAAAARPSCGARLAFGAGPHACVGASFTRALADAMLEALGTLPTELRLAGRPVRLRRVALRGLASLPLRLDA